VDTWRAVAITYCDVGDMALGYVGCGGITHCDVGDMAMEYFETKVEPKRGISIRGISIHGSRYVEPITGRFAKRRSGAALAINQNVDPGRR
jgi:hypothetical protein